MPFREPREKAVGNLTKDQISDLRSYQERVVVCTLDNERTLNALKVAKAQLETFLWKLEHEEEGR